MRETTRWVPIDQVVPHPDNANRMNARMREKLVRLIDESDRVPPLIVRSLEESEAFVDLHEAGKLQLLDGEHRWLAMNEIHDRDPSRFDVIEVKIFHGVTDIVAKQYLATFNNIHGEDVPERRAALVRALVEEFGLKRSAEILPENEERIQSIVASTRERAKQESVSLAQRVSRVSSLQPMTVYGPAEDVEIIRRAIRSVLNDDEELAEVQGREGIALAKICREWLGE